MQVSEYGKQLVVPRAFWGAVLIVALFLGAMGVYFLQTGHVPTIPRWGNWALLFIVWAGALFRLLKNGRKVFTPLYVMSIVALTLAFGTELVPPHLAAARTWAGNIGYIIIITCILAQYIQVNKRK